MITVDYPSAKLLPLVDEAIRFLCDEQETVVRSREPVRDPEKTVWQSLKDWWAPSENHWAKSIREASEDLDFRSDLKTLKDVRRCANAVDWVRLDSETLSLITRLCGK